MKDTIKEKTCIQELLQREKRTMGDGMKQNLVESIELLAETVTKKRKDRDSIEYDIRTREKAKTVAQTKERELRKKREKMDKPLQVGIEMELLPKYDISMSKYHGWKMEGPSI